MIALLICQYFVKIVGYSQIPTLIHCLAYYVLYATNPLHAYTHTYSDVEAWWDGIVLVKKALFFSGLDYIFMLESIKLYMLVVLECQI